MKKDSWIISPTPNAGYGGGGRNSGGSGTGGDIGGIEGVYDVYEGYRIIGGNEIRDGNHLLLILMEVLYCDIYTL